MPSDEHDALVLRACQWLRSSPNSHGVVVAELSTAAISAPDVFGCGGQGTTSIEVKVSRADFRRDRRKLSHLVQQIPGSRRYYMTPPGLVRSYELPHGWGLLYAHPPKGKQKRGRVEVVCKADRAPLESHARPDENLLYSIARRRLEEPPRYRYDPVTFRFVRLPR